MIDDFDKKTQTLPLEPVKRGRGRPKTGQAMTPAEKQRAYRERQKKTNGLLEKIAAVINEELKKDQQDKYSRAIGRVQAILESKT